MVISKREIGKCGVGGTYDFRGHKSAAFYRNFNIFPRSKNVLFQETIGKSFFANCKVNSLKIVCPPIEISTFI